MTKQQPVPDWKIFLSIDDALYDFTLPEIASYLENTQKTTFYSKCAAIFYIREYGLYREVAKNVEEWGMNFFEWNNPRSVYYHYDAYVIIKRLLKLSPELDILPRKLYHTQVILKFQPEDELLQSGWNLVDEYVKAGEKLTGRLIDKAFKSLIDIEEDELDFIDEENFSTGEIKKRTLTPTQYGIGDWDLTEIVEDIFLPKPTSYTEEGRIVTVIVRKPDDLDIIRKQAMGNPDWYFACLSFSCSVYRGINDLPGNIWLGYMIADQGDYDDVDVEIDSLLCSNPVFLYLNTHQAISFNRTDDIDMFFFAPNQTWENFSAMRTQLPDEKVSFPSNVLTPVKHYPVPMF